MTKTRTTILVIAGVFIALGAFFLFTNTGHALGGPFGGPIITGPIPCVDEGGYLIVVGPPRGGTFYINFGTKIFANFNPATIGTFVLGFAGGFSPCSNAGVPTPPGGGEFVIIIGTS